MRRLSGLPVASAIVVLGLAAVAAGAGPVLYGQGSNGYGSLGLGDINDRKTPTEIAALSTPGVVRVAAGGWHTMAVTPDGRLWTWGYNSRGQLGLGDEGDGTHRNTPTLVPALNGCVVTMVAAGWSHSIAYASDGVWWAWGNNDYGQLGTGAGSSNTPVQITAMTGLSPSALALGSNHTLALTTDGHLWAWGRNSKGQLGLGDTADRATPAEVTFFSAMTITGIAAGLDHSLVVTSDGQVWSFGLNAHGQLGHGDTVDRSTPTAVAALAGRTATLVGAGIRTTFVATSDNRVWSCGYNNYGQLGVGDKTDRKVPTELTVLAGKAIVALASGGQWFGAALTSSGEIWAWGSNSSGELGQGDTTQRSSPVSVGALAGIPIARMVVGGNHLVALTSEENARPVADSQAVTAVTGVAKAITLTGSDGDGDPLTYHIVTGPSHGMLDGDPPNVTYTSYDTHSGSDSFTFKANDGYDDSDPSTVTITIDPAGTSLYTIDRSGTITDLVILRQFDLKRTTDNMMLEGKTIAFKVDGTEVGTGTTNAGGDSTLNWAIGDGPASRAITVEFAGDAAYSGCSDDATLTCETSATKTTGINREGKITAYRILKAWLWRMDNSPVAGKGIAFKLEGTLLGTDITRSTGLAQIGYTIADGAGAGSRTILAEWAGDSGYLASSCTNTLTVLKATPFIWVMPRSVPQGGIARLYAYFRRLADYQKQAGKTVSFKVDGTWVADVVTGTGADAGIARHPYTVVEAPGAHTMRCEFAGDAWVDAGYGEATLTIH